MQITSNAHIHMPMIMTRKHLYHKYLGVMSSTNSITLSEQHFTRLFKIKTFFKHVMFPRFTRLGTCNICASTNDSITNKSMSHQQRNALKLRKQEHLLLVEQERNIFVRLKHDLSIPLPNYHLFL